MIPVSKESSLMVNLPEAWAAVDVLFPAQVFIAEDLLQLSSVKSTALSEQFSLSDKDSFSIDSMRDLLLLLQVSLAEGNLCLTSKPEELKDVLLRSGLSTEVSDHFAVRISGLVADDRVEVGLAPLFEQGILVRRKHAGNVYLYAGRYDRAIQGIRDFVNPNSFAIRDEFDDEARSWFKDILVDRPIRSVGAAVGFTVEQRLALYMGLTEPFFILSGGPGTGKTTIILNLLRLLIRSGIGTAGIRLAAPTGKAAARMMESITQGLKSIANPTVEDQSIASLNAGTIHALLGIRPGNETPTSNANDPIDADCLIIDEVSMVDTILMSFLISATDRQRTRLILIGDKEQLPSVESGAVLSDLIQLLSGDGPVSYAPDIVRRAIGVVGQDDAWKDLPLNEGANSRFVHLTHSHRSEQAVRELALWINNGAESQSPLTLMATSAEIPSLPDEGTFLLKRSADTRQPPAGTFIDGLVRSWGHLAFPPEWEIILQKLAKHPAPERRFIDQKETVSLIASLFEILNRHRILTVLRKGPDGAEAIQHIFRRYMASRSRLRERRGLFSGLPILVRRNDPLRGLTNGDTGIIVELADRRMLAVFEGDPVLAFSPDVLPQWEAAYAMTVHKSQGSEYLDVLMILPEEAGHPLMSRQILYTGITRARKRIILCGSEEGIGLAARKGLQRITGLL